MLISFQRRLFDSFQKCVKCRIPRQITAHDYGINEKPNQIAQFGAFAIGYGRTYANIILCGISVQKSLEGSQ